MLGSAILRLFKPFPFGNPDERPEEYLPYSLGVNLGFEYGWGKILLVAMILWAVISWLGGTTGATLGSVLGFFPLTGALMAVARIVILKAYMVVLTGPSAIWKSVRTCRLVPGPTLRKLVEPTWWDLLLQLAVSVFAMLLVGVAYSF